VNGRIVSEEGW